MVPSFTKKPLLKITVNNIHISQRNDLIKFSCEIRYGTVKYRERWVRSAGVRWVFDVVGQLLCRKWPSSK